MTPFELFGSVPVDKQPSTMFNLSHEVKLSTRMGRLTPIFCEETLPGDKWSISPEVYARFAPLLAPVMHRMDMRIDFFYIPNRIIWNEWEDYLTKGLSGDSTAPVIPHMSQGFLTNLFENNVAGISDRLNVGELMDYMQFPALQYYSKNNPSNEFAAHVTSAPKGSGMTINILPLRAYQLIYNEYYRDQNLEDPIDINLGSGEINQSEFLDLTEWRYRALEKDYFTAALPFIQRGADVTIPIAGNAPVVFNRQSSDSVAQKLVYHDGEPYNNDYYEASSGSVNGGVVAPDPIQGGFRFVSTDNHGNIVSRDWGASIQSGVNGAFVAEIGNVVDAGGSPDTVYLDPNGTLTADMSGVTAATINDLRRAVALQSFLEASARGGNRYKELLQAHSGVWIKDGRIDRPEYLGGLRAPIQISEQMSLVQNGDVPQGNPSGTAVSVASKRCVRRWVPEHGWIIGLLSIKPRTAYMQGIRRHYLKNDVFDLGWPKFAHLGEQPVFHSEVFFGNYLSDAPWNQTFGYVPRYAEYKYIPSHVHGDFLTNLRHWHMARFLSSDPVTVNNAFVKSTPASVFNDFNRIFAVEEDADNVWIQIYMKTYARRHLPKYGTPRLLG